MTQAFQAMNFARRAHANQVRKYTGNPYADHLAEVAGIVATVAPEFKADAEAMICTAWLHDYIEDVNPAPEGRKILEATFGAHIAVAVTWLTDAEEGNRAQRKELARWRLAAAPGWVQTVKCADIISNTSSIVQHDPNFAVVYLREKRELLEVLTAAHPDLRRMATECSS